MDDYTLRRFRKRLKGIERRQEALNERLSSQELYTQRIFERVSYLALRFGYEPKLPLFSLGEFPPPEPATPAKIDELFQRLEFMLIELNGVVRDKVDDH